MNITSFRIIDSTLREGEQFALAHFTIEQKLAIAAALDRSASTTWSSPHR
jgi:homocitrate synthase